MDLEAVRTVVVGVAHHIDGRRWADLRALFDEEVETDYTSLFGGSPGKQPADALLAGWRAALQRVATQHLLGPIEVRLSGATASASCHVRALHHAAGAPGGETWDVLGHYVFDLVRRGPGWRIAKMKLETFIQTGNRRLLAEAAG